jgi:hypothetical protein
MRVTNDVPVNFKRGACIGMAELSLNDFGRGSRVKQERSVSVAEGVKAAPGDSQRVQDGPQVILDHFV